MLISGVSGQFFYLIAYLADNILLCQSQMGDAMNSEEIAALAAVISEASQIPMAVAISSLLLTIAGLGLAFWQLQKLNTQIECARIEMDADHERTRRQNTIDIVKYYVDKSRPEHNKMMQIMENIDVKELRNLWEGRVVTIPRENKDMACSALRPSFPDIDKNYSSHTGSITLSHPESMQLRFIMLDLLNLIETCLIPWHLGVADSDSMLEQFSPLVRPVEGKFRLSDARRVVGQEKFPATMAFKKFIEDRSNPKIPLETIDSKATSHP